MIQCPLPEKTPSLADIRSRVSERISKWNNSHPDELISYRAEAEIFKAIADAWDELNG